MMWVLQILFVFAWSFSVALAASDDGPKCKDDNGNDVDRFVMYKLPQGQELGPNLTPENYIADGRAYVYLDESGAGRWVLSEKPMSSENSPIGLLHSYIKNHENDLTYVFYSDQPPDEGASSTAHAKGILAFGRDVGIWLSHSVPHFPPDPQSNYDYPESGQVNGQVLFCVTLPRSAANTVAYQLRVMSVHMYATHIADYETDYRSHLVRLAKRKWLRGGPKTKVIKLQSLNNANFVSFSKNKKFHKDLYDDLIAPELKVSLFANTWLNGAGGRMSSDCHDEYKVNNILELNVRFKEGGKNGSDMFATTQDHSKWAISSEGQEPWTCVADMNRMLSQAKRGGGAICWKSPSSWKAFGDTISDIEGCIRENQPLQCRLDKNRFLNQGSTNCL